MNLVHTYLLYSQFVLKTAVGLYQINNARVKSIVNNHVYQSFREWIFWLFMVGFSHGGNADLLWVSKNQTFYPSFIHPIIHTRFQLESTLLTHYSTYSFCHLVPIEYWKRPEIIYWIENKNKKRTGSLISVRSWNFKDGGSLKARFLAKNQYATKEKSLKKSYK